MKYHSALERNGVLTLATTWMNLENVVLGEMSATKGQNVG